MELLPRDIIFLIAKLLPAESILELSLSLPRFKWLINDNLLFKHLCQRDFGCTDDILRCKRVLPDYNRRYKFVYKVIKYLEFEITTAIRMKEQRLNIPLQIISIQSEGQRMMDGLMGVPLIDSSNNIDGGWELTKISHLNLQHKCSVAECKYSGEYHEGSFDANVLVTRQGLAVWNNQKSKYYLVYPMNLVEKMINKHYKPGSYDGKIRKDRYKLAHPNVENSLIGLTAYAESVEECKKFGFSREDYKE